MSDTWWWSLKDQRAVTGAERGKDEDVLGPYPSKEAAENWKETSAQRDQAWKAEDERWEGDDRGATGDDPGSGGD